ncbi:helix-turn-helix domain-containing protein [Candidatus Aerophobetes bacterium]|nr:helix-turn-helix domain-containing protein [Candidatus Aerophobetes bacterium]
MKKEYLTIPEFAKILGVSRISVYKHVKKGNIEAKRVGRIYLIPYKYAEGIVGNRLSEQDKKEIEEAVNKTATEYGETLRLLGKE